MIDEIDISVALIISYVAMECKKLGSDLTEAKKFWKKIRYGGVGAIATDSNEKILSFLDRLAVENEDLKILSLKESIDLSLDIAAGMFHNLHEWATNKKEVHDFKAIDQFLEDVRIFV